ncbi:MAG: PTS sugar transporter subunit IIA [Tractidigestivibacter sp.]|uniref:PTS sugar transporter subunit IIA n=1 Tax=Tractidigestivibacter sp. TaxID=2847320 RepID=UPI003D92C754
MGLIDRIRATFYSDEGTPVPKKASFKTSADTVYAPVSGLLVKLADVRDEAVSSGLLGSGCGIVPGGSTTVYSPVSGRVSSTSVSNHAIGITTPDDIEVLIHIGIDTVNMNGRGFTRFVEENDEVKAGDPLVHFDPEAIKAAGYDDIVVVVVSNDDAFDGVDVVANSGTTVGGLPLVKIGDPLLGVTRK